MKNIMKIKQRNMLSKSSIFRINCYRENTSAVSFITSWSFQIIIFINGSNPVNIIDNKEISQYQSRTYKGPGTYTKDYKRNIC